MKKIQHVDDVSRLSLCGVYGSLMYMCWSAMSWMTSRISMQTDHSSSQTTM